MRRWLEPLRGTDSPLSGLPEAPTVRQATAWFTHHSDGLTSEEDLRLKQLLDHCQELADTVAHVREFAKIMDQLDGVRRLPGWIGRAENAELPMIRAFARNLREEEGERGEGVLQHRVEEGGRYGRERLGIRAVAVRVPVADDVLEVGVVQAGEQADRVVDLAGVPGQPGLGGGCAGSRAGRRP
ncbi:hypothetical protein GCM10023080_065580 [Streptomyces pseudoechinosporeus]